MRWVWTDVGIKGKMKYLLLFCYTPPPLNLTAAVGVDTKVSDSGSL